ncbi:MAG TPA: fumarylacetoacetate hydrolase family protein [Stellaceae bacterium]|nr:fumarylacetoacetate hydrolase family protein [Stellaceae bacterium]
MKLVTISVPPGGRPGVVVGDDVLDFALAAPVLPLAGWVPPAMPALLAAGSEGLDLVRRLVDRVASGGVAARLKEAGALRPLASLALLAPVPRPGIVLSHGRAYKSHLKEMNSKGEDEPHAFMKNVNAIIGPGAPIVLPPQCPAMVDLEGEFSVVFGAPCHNVSEAEAMNYVAGYTIINDVSARDWVESFQKTKDPDQNRMGKQLPTFCPMGPVIATKDEIADPNDVHMVTTLNGKVMQDSNTSDLIWNIPQLIAYYARWYRFMPGDVMTTGSPAGVGYGRNPKVFMQPGDVVTATVEPVGTLSNPVRAAAN